MSGARAAPCRAKATVAAGTDAWERWLPRWSVAFGTILAVATGAALLDPELGGAGRVAALWLAAAVAGWYWALVLRRPTRPGPVGWPLLYVAGAVGLFVALTTVHPAFMLLIFCLYWQIYGFLPLRWATLAAAPFSLVVWWRGAAVSGRPFSLDGSDLFIAGTSLAVSAMFGWYIDAIIRQSGDRRALIERLAAAQAELAAVERQTGVLQERQRLAHEIHDTLAQGFTSIVLHLEAADPALPAEAETARRHLDQARRTARAGLADARRLVWALRPAALDRGTLGEALGGLVASWSEETGVAATTVIAGAPRRLHPAAEVTLLRAAQETLANVRRHAAARAVTLTLTYMDDEVVLDTQDDGGGFDVGAPPTAHPHPNSDGTTGGYGLTGMRERAATLGGRVDVESAPGQGTTVAVALPALTLPEAAPDTPEPAPATAAPLSPPADRDFAGDRGRPRAAPNAAAPNATVAGR